MKKTYLQRWGRDRTKKVKASNSGRKRAKRAGALKNLYFQLEGGKKRVKDALEPLSPKDKERITNEIQILETKLQYA